MPGEQGMNRREKNRTDRRTKYTRNLIKEVLMAFLKERRFETITVTEICRRAEINRGTFYLHYLDTYNVLEDLVDDFLSETTDTVQHVLCPQQSSCTHSLCSRIQSSEKYWPLLMHDTAAAQVLNKLMENGKSGFSGYLMQNSSLTKDQAEAVFAFQINGCLAINRMMIQNRTADWQKIQAAVDQYIRAGLECLSKNDDF